MTCVLHTDKISNVKNCVDRRSVKKLVNFELGHGIKKDVKGNLGY